MKPGFLILCAFFTVSPIWAVEINVRDTGAVGDGKTLDRKAIQTAIDKCSEKGGGVVKFPAGEYLTGTIRLRSHLQLYLEAGARLIGTTNLDEYTQPTTPEFMPESGWGKWHRGMIIGEGLEEIAIAGPGIINGNKVFDPTGEEKMRGPHTIALVNCTGITLRDITIRDAANYACFFQASDDFEIRNVTFVGGWDGVHWRGAPDRWCHNAKIIDCRFYTGDDAIAGRYWDNTVIQNCYINSSCNGIRLIGPATRLTIAHNLFRGPGEQPHRTSGPRRRTNMLSGIILQPGAWDATRGVLDEVFIADNVMEQVASPITVWMKPGNTIGKVTIDGLHATGVYRSGFSFESWGDSPITNVIMRSVSAEFSGGAQAWPELSVKGPGVDARALPAWGLYARKVQNLTLEDVRFAFTKRDTRPVVRAEQVDRLEFSEFHYPAILPEPFSLEKVGELKNSAERKAR
jgi:hypothetical protein